MQKQLVFSFIIFITFFTTVVYASQGMQIESGLTSFQVFQRNAQNTAKIEFKGSCPSGSGSVAVRIQNLRGTLPAFDRIVAGKFRGKKFSANIEALPVGGPYQIEVHLKTSSGKMVARTTVSNVLVGDLWILAGQSNMQGIGDLQLENPPSVYVNSYGYDESWGIASDPLHWLLDSVDPVHHLGLSGEQLENARKWAKENAVVGAGCGLPFAAEMVAATGVPVGLVPCAHGGTSMTQWDPSRRDEGGNSLYGSMFRRFKAVGGKVTGVLWYQGESDANPKAVPLFHDRLVQLVAAIRKDFNDPNLPFYQVQIGRYVVPSHNPSWKEIQSLQVQSANEIENCEIVSSVDLELDDLIHVSTRGHLRLGLRLATLALRDLFGFEAYQTGPQFDSIEPVPFRQPCYRVNFSGVNGALRNMARPTGFSFRDSSGQDLNLIFKTTVSVDGQAIELFLRNHPPDDAFLWYAYDLNAYCNVVDEMDMGLLAFGPVPMQAVNYWRIVEQLQDAESNLAEYIPFLGPVVTRYPDRQAELKQIFRQKMNELPANAALRLAPVLFALDDFSEWEKWLDTAKFASLDERKKMAQIFRDLPSTSALKTDFVRNWQVVGSFDNADDAGFDRIYAPERNQKWLLENPNHALDSLKWQPASANPNGLLDFMKIFEKKQNVVAYALAVVESRQKTTLPLLLGSDDAAVVWVNGREIHREHRHRGARPASDLMLVDLNAGKNAILVKVDQVGGDWGLFLQLVDREGVLKY